MKATIVLIADNDAENYGRKLMLQAHRAGNLGFEMARLPQHVSLKQPFSIPNLEKFEEFFDGFAKKLSQIKIKFEELNFYSSNVLEGYESGCLSISIHKNEQLDFAQKMLFEELEIKFGPCPAEHDNDYIFHMTIAIGGAPFNNYEKAYKTLNELYFNQEFVFNKLGLLYYDDDSIKPGTYFCYKVVDIRNL